jgi:hypothetical protein
MTNLTISVSDEVAREYYLAAEKLAEHYSELGKTPDARTLMNFTLGSMTADDIARNFDWTLQGMLFPESRDSEESEA